MTYPSANFPFYLFLSKKSSIYDEEPNNNDESNDENAEKITRGAISAKLYLRYFVDGIGWLSAIFLFGGMMVVQVGL